jgi:hypothetical protein
MINATERRVCFDARFYEEIMKIIVTLIALGAVVCGVTSAVYWLRSAFEELRPDPADLVALSRWFDILPDAKISRRAEDCRLNVISHFDAVNVPRLTSNEIPGPRAQAGYLSADQC